MARSAYRLLDNPVVYNVSQAVLAPGAGTLLERNFRSLFGSSKGLILDVGCGPRLNTFVASGKVYGVDVHLEYLRQYATGPDRKSVAASANALPFLDNSFNESRSFGLLHHLSDDKAALAVREMARCTRPGGRIVIIDNVWPRQPLLRPLAWLNRKMDRGKWVRREEELSSLLKGAFPGQWQHTRFTYTYVGHEAVAYVCEKTDRGNP